MPIKEFGVTVPRAGLNDRVYIALDVETTGPRIGFDSMLSFGACVVTPEKMDAAAKREEGHVYYAELKPTSLNFEPPAIAKGASQLNALRSVWTWQEGGPRYYSKHTAFDGKLTLRYLQDSRDTVHPATAIRDFARWVADRGRMKDVVGVVDTAGFDLAWLMYYCTEHGGIDPIFGHTGFDLKAYWRGLSGDPEASLKSLGVKDDREYPHRSDDDAIFSAELARVLLFEKTPLARRPKQRGSRLEVIGGRAGGARRGC